MSFHDKQAMRPDNKDLNHIRVLDLLTATRLF
jgi:hypothetical protein